MHTVYHLRSKLRGIRPAEIKKAGGIIGWLSGKKRKVEEVRLELETIYIDINRLKTGFIKRINLRDLPSDEALARIRLEVAREFQQAKRKMKNEQNRLDEKKNRITKELTMVINDLENSKKTLNKEIEKLKTEIRDITKEKKETKKLMKDSQFLKNKWPIYGSYKSEDIVCTSPLISDGKGKMVCGGLKKEGIFIYDIRTRSCDVLSGHKKGITSVVMNPQENFLISAGYDGQIILWNLEEKKIIKKIDTEDEILCLALV